MLAAFYLASAILVDSKSNSTEGHIMSKYLGDEWRHRKDELTVKFLQETDYQLTEKDQQAVDRAKELIQRVYKYKKCHLASCGLFGSGSFKHGTHIYCRRLHEFSQCAEARVIERAHWSDLIGNPDTLLTLATFHGSHNGNGDRIGEPYLISPCPKCLRLLEQEAPDCLVVVDLLGDGRLAKVPLEAVDFFRHPKDHNGG